MQSLFQALVVYQYTSPSDNIDYTSEICYWDPQNTVWSDPLSVFRYNIQVSTGVIECASSTCTVCNTSKLAANANTVVLSDSVSCQEIFSYEIDTGHQPLLSAERLMRKYCSIGTVTDLCNSADLPEVEILSLIEEQIPKYRLRADTITDFRGYRNADWVIQTPIIDLDEDLDLTDDQIAETLKYFILCSERVTQMTRTYNDVEAVSRLLEEKERDLELAARIGQTLLQKNKELAIRNEEFEEQLSNVNERVGQLRHELGMKDELLRFYTEEIENAETESSDGSTNVLDNIDMGCLHKKVQSLEDENLHLRLETLNLTQDTENYEEKEQRLMNECVNQLAEFKDHLNILSDEVHVKTGENRKQKEDITTLLAQVVDSQMKNKVVTVENVELSKHLEEAMSSQKQLTNELGGLQDRYDELFALFEDTQEEMRRIRSRQRPHVVRQHYMSTPHLAPESGGPEMETSLRDELHGLSPWDKSPSSWKIFETAKAAHKSVERKATSREFLSVPASRQSRSRASTDIGDSASANASVRGSLYLSDGESAPSDGYSGDESSLGLSSVLGRSRLPGSNDLETALKRLSLRRANELNEYDFRADQRDKASRLTSETGNTPPNSCATPESMFSSTSDMSRLSTMSGISGGGASGGPGYKYPNKLQIIKPMEGSNTLRQWQHLATPHLAGIFEPRPGVQIKGERKLELQEEYNLSDYEEDEDYSSCPSKSTSVKRMSSIPGSEQFNLAKPPKKKVPSNFGMSLGLAAILDERVVTSTLERGVAIKDKESNLIDSEAKIKHRPPPLSLGATPFSPGACSPATLKSLSSASMENLTDYEKHAKMLAKSDQAAIPKQPSQRGLVSVSSFPNLYSGMPTPSSFPNLARAGSEESDRTMTSVSTTSTGILPNLLDKLKSSSLYSLWSWSSLSSIIPGHESDASSSNVDVSRSDTTTGTHTVMSTKLAMATGWASDSSSSVVTVTSSGLSSHRNSLETVANDKPVTCPKVEQAQGVGVLGVMTDMRRNGLL